MVISGERAGTTTPTTAKGKKKHGPKTDPEAKENNGKATVPRK